MMRLIAVLVLFTPGVIAAFGIKLMRDSLFDAFFNAGLQFLVGLVMFLGGIAFIGGFIVHRDRKKNLIQK